MFEEGYCLLFESVIDDAGDVMCGYDSISVINLFDDVGLVFILLLVGLMGYGVACSFGLKLCSVLMEIS